jgi:hypothetical protein
MLEIIPLTQLKSRMEAAEAGLEVMGAKVDEAKDDRSFERVAYAVYALASNEWSKLQIMAMPEKDHEGKPIIEPNAGCNQRFDLPDGKVLLPVRYYKQLKVTKVWRKMISKKAHYKHLLVLRSTVKKVWKNYVPQDENTLVRKQCKTFVLNTAIKKNL